MFRARCAPVAFPFRSYTSHRRGARARSARAHYNRHTPRTGDSAIAHDATAVEPPPVDARPQARPFLKWAGGKTQLREELVRRLPPRIDSYYEPFAGGGALFFRLASDPERAPRRAVLNDLNAELITTYEAVRDSVEPLSDRLNSLEHDYLARDAEGRAEDFYAVRAEAPTEPLEVAARLIFLNKTCFNGLYRVNRSGRFNVPHGRYQRPRILDRDGLQAASAALAGVELLSVDFEEACAGAGPGDLVYFDPPFHPLSETSSFTAYTQGDFGRGDQLRLKWCIDGLRERGAPTLLSNSPHQWILGLYEGSRYEIDRVSARRAINAQGQGRGPIDELAITSYPQPG